MRVDLADKASSVSAFEVGPLPCRRASEASEAMERCGKLREDQLERRIPHAIVTNTLRAKDHQASTGPRSACLKPVPYIVWHHLAILIMQLETAHVRLSGLIQKSFPLRGIYER